MSVPTVLQNAAILAVILALGGYLITGSPPRLAREVQHGRIFCVEYSCASDQPHSQRVVEVPVAQVQRIRESGTRGRAGNAHVKQLGIIGLQANPDVVQGLAPSELREGHDAKQIGATKRAHTCIAPVPFNDACKGFSTAQTPSPAQTPLAHVHATLPVIESRKLRKRATSNSSRGHPEIAVNYKWKYA